MIGLRDYRSKKTPNQNQAHLLGDSWNEWIGRKESTQRTRRKVCVTVGYWQFSKMGEEKEIKSL